MLSSSLDLELLFVCMIVWYLCCRPGKPIASIKEQRADFSSSGSLVV